MDYKELPESECKKLIIELFRSIPELLKQVAPNGFDKSPLICVFHPTLEQRYERYKNSYYALLSMKKLSKSQSDIEPIKGIDEFKKEIEDTPVNDQYEIVSIFGDCIWNIFSNNHTVFNEDFESYHLGSWRGSAGFIANVINDLNLVPKSSFNYMNFYMGNFMAMDFADLIPVYEFIFKKLKSKGLDWEFSFPRAGLIHFSKDDDPADNLECYDASTSMEQQFEQQKKKKKIDEFQHRLDNIYHEEYEKARYSKPSQEVLAYYSVFAHWPKGHPLAEN